MGGAIRDDERRLVSARSRDRKDAVSIFQAIVLGLTQGATEYAPVSSSGHLILVPWLFDWSIVQHGALNKTFDVALHMGTLVGALIYFRHEVVRYLRAWLTSIGARAIRDTDERIAWALVIGTIPGAIAGALFENAIEDNLGQPWLIATMLAAFGVVLWTVDRRARNDRDLDTIGPRTGLLLGIAQAVALQPGVSRSGITITAARAIGLDREAAARFSFLLSLPIIAGAGAFKALDLVQNGFQGYGAEFFWGFVSSAVSGFIVIWILLRYLRRHSFALFMWYRLAVAALCVVLIVTGVRSATI
jgi:undecaprenyl-diphosphatase